jgi:uncharacterized Zn-binding protein involved in type VI secretion
MAQVVCSGAMLTCSFGVAPSSLTVTPEGRVNSSTMPAATIMDHVPMKNIMPFGVLTPMPCIPVTTSPWTPGSPTVMIGGKPALTSSSTCMCTWGGVITVSSPGQMTVNAP